ncbi:MAG: hypothetical protein LBT61_00270 [Prevotellaceae bacterium]|jgi:uncharacterized protein (TIGR02145 family)|nr:hypothetical protein [Prevotellaceae bacterium]
MKKTKTIQMLLVAVLAGLSISGYAQGKVCYGNTYEIMELQVPSDPSAYKWFENDQEISGAKTAGYTVPANKPVGRYTYIRRSKKDGCDEWSKSNVYVVNVMSCSTLDENSAIGAKGTFQDPRDNKVYKTVKMPDGKIWFAENLNYQKGLTWNKNAAEANGVSYTSLTDGTGAIGSFWCSPAVAGATSADMNTCFVYGALYSWPTALLPDGQGTWTAEFRNSRECSVSGTATCSTPVRGVCPEGWHIPSAREYDELVNAVEAVSPNKAGVALRSNEILSETFPHGWRNSDYPGTDEFGFSFLPALIRTSSDGGFAPFAAQGWVWSSNIGYQQWTFSYYARYNHESFEQHGTYVSAALNVRCQHD